MSMLPTNRALQEQMIRSISDHSPVQADAVHLRLSVDERVTTQGGKALQHFDCSDYSVRERDASGRLGREALGFQASNGVARLARTRSNALSSRKVLLLQGPIGPFFRKLQRELEQLGAQVTHVLFNAGDELYAGRHGCVRFSGTLDGWHDWLNDYLTRNEIDTIVYFGCKRPAHRVANSIANDLGIRVVSLEEGYIRSGYITCEEQGNNDLSPIMGQIPHGDADWFVPDPVKSGPTFKIMCWWGMTYYLWRSWFSRETDKPLFHRQVLGPWKDTVFWVSNTLRLLFEHFREKRAIAGLTRRFDKDYILVALQMPSDSQMKEAANGWSIERLIETSLSSLAATNSVERIVFKIHPLDGQRRAREDYIRQVADRYGVAARTLVLHTGSIADLCRHADGMIIVNSTTAFTAIHHGTPLLVLGQAVCRNENIVTCGRSEQDVSRFFRERWVAEATLRKRYIRFLKARSQIPGDFYGPDGARTGARNVARAILGSI